MAPSSLNVEFLFLGFLKSELLCLGFLDTLGELRAFLLRFFYSALSRLQPVSAFHLQRLFRAVLDRISPLGHETLVLTLSCDDR